MILQSLACLTLGAACAHAADGLPRVDLHVHLDDEKNSARRIAPADAAALSEKMGVRFGVLAEGGCRGDIHDDQSLGAFLKGMEGQPMWRGLQVYGFEWRHCLSKQLLDQLDYIAADALVFPQPAGRPILLWLPDVKIADPQEFMERYVDYNVRVISQSIQVWANPTYLPESLKSKYDELWTPERMDRVIQAVVKNGVAIEINAHFQIPSQAFIRRAKAAGAKFSIGSNRHYDGIGEIDYCLRTAKACGLTAKDIFVPARPLAARH